MEDERVDVDRSEATSGEVRMRKDYAWSADRLDESPAT